MSAVHMIGRVLTRAVWATMAAGALLASSLAVAEATPVRVLSLDNTWACSVPAGYTYDQVVNQLNVCSPSNFAYSYHIRIPQNGLWACTVPPGFTYSQTSNQLNVCSPSNFAYSYLLRG